MAALLKPQPAYDLVRGIKAALGDDVRVHVHVHATTGVTLVSLMKAIEAGADCVDTCHQLAEPRARPQPDRVAGRDARRHAVRHAGSTSRGCSSIKEHFARIRPRYAEFLSNITGVETEIFDSQIPGGMISNMESQLKQQGAADRIKEVLAEVPHVRARRRLPAARHAVEPDRRHAGGVQRDDGPLQGDDRRVRRPDARLLRRHDRAARPDGHRDSPHKHAKKEPITCRPADLLKPEWDELRAQAIALDGCNGTDEDVLTYAMFPQVAPKFFARAARGPEEPRQGVRRRSLRRRPPSPGGGRRGRRPRPGADGNHLRREVRRDERTR